MYSAFYVLLAEGSTLWILFTVPRELQGILLRKTVLWGGVAVAYCLMTLIGAAATGRSFGWEALPEAATAVAGVGIFSFIGAALGILGTRPLEVDVQRRVRPDIVQVFMLIAGLFAYAFYTPSAWAKLSLIVLCASLAFALWQKAAEDIPFLLDPTASPRPRILLSDGLVAALAFFVLQGLIGFVLERSGAPAGARQAAAYGGAGSAVALVSLLVFRRRKVPDLPTAVGLRSGRSGAGRSALTGLAAGVAAGAFGLAYLWAAERIDSLRSLKEDSSGPGGTSWWLAGLTVVAAPLFEEFIFRGLIYRGLRRSLKPMTAVLASAALFAVVHPPMSVVPVFVMGMLAALSFERTRFLLAPIIAHAVYNAMVLIGS